ncbi:hypothetical protein A5862_000330 [Enterococcus faecalis]|uniref:hypothetical protein n=1 Tax=Enterococcus faecalis TaxID=1351 RepID=UPI000B6D55B6|nr:hypothetical protein [Enterococcus faecalis]OTP38960.1 hypothetical protein A5862_000330 [Enterococcus faecalis]
MARRKNLRHTRTKTSLTETTIPQFNTAAMNGKPIRAIETPGATPESPSSIKVDGPKPTGKPMEKKNHTNNATTKIKTGTITPTELDALQPQQRTQDQKEQVKKQRPSTAKKNHQEIQEDMAKKQKTKEKQQQNKTSKKRWGKMQNTDKDVAGKHIKTGTQATGSDLAAVEETLPTGKTENSNPYILAKDKKKSDNEVKHINHPADHPEEEEKSQIDNTQKRD